MQKDEEYLKLLEIIKALTERVERLERKVDSATKEIKVLKEGGNI